MFRALNHKDSVLGRLKLSYSVYKTVRQRSRNHYEILGIPRTASQEDVKAAFVSLSKQLHPDKNPGHPENHEKFVRLNEAYTVLSKPSKRQDYDLTLFGSWAGSQPYSHTRHASWEPDMQQKRERLYRMHMEQQENEHAEQQANIRRTAAVLTVVVVLLTAMRFHITVDYYKRSRSHSLQSGKDVQLKPVGIHVNSITTESGSDGSQDKR